MTDQTEYARAAYAQYPSGFNSQQHAYRVGFADGVRHATQGDSMEKVLAFPADKLGPFLQRFAAAGGILTDPQAVADVTFKVIDTGELGFIDRGPAETDPSFKQVIPYSVLVRKAAGGGLEYLTYRRTPKGGEGRLHGKRSLGVGGHVNPEDGEAGGPGTYDRAFKRELAEEIGYREASRLDLDAPVLALVYDPSDAVGQVHFGVVHAVGAPPADGREVRFADPALADGVWASAAELARDAAEFENWSKLIIESGVLK